MDSTLPKLIVGGIDEAGRGPLAGPVTAAAVVLPIRYRNSKLTDSKAVSEKKRDMLFDEITHSAVAYSVVSLGPREIEKYNIREATRHAMIRAAEQVLTTLRRHGSRVRCHFMVDGNMQLTTSLHHEAVVKGDSKILCISAASILAKVTRDREMLVLDAKYPEYGFAGHKGYPTKTHREKIRELGPTDIHRRTFAGVREYL